jgi:NAD(P)-dependent dehydrogenase (short-subunit alcohol dehydrogenase family)
MVKLKPVEEQVVVLMGASSGIGRETALRFARKGARVVVSARGEEGLDSLVEEIRAEGGDASYVVAEVTDFDQVKAVADRAVEEYGRLDSWVHLAAVGLFATSQQTTPEEFERVIDVNLMGQVYGAMAALPHIKLEGRGALIHISSVEAKRSFPVSQRLRCLQAWHRQVSEGATTGTQARGMADKREPGYARYHKHALLRQGAHQARRQGGGHTTDLRAWDRGGHNSLRCGEPCARSRLRGCRTGIDPQPAPLPAHARCDPRNAGRIRSAEEPRSEDDPDNLYAPIRGHDTAKNGFRALSRSFYNWMEMHPVVRRGAAAGMALGLLAALRVRS